MHHVEINFVDYVKRVDLHIGHEPDAWKLAHKLGLTVKPGDENGLDGKVITVARHLYRTKHAQGIIRHEIGHYLLQLSNTEAEIFSLRNSYEAGVPTIEKLCYHASLILHMEDKHLEQAHIEFGNTPQAIVRIAELSGAPVVDALHRWVYAEVGASRAAWIVRNGLVIEAASANLWLPFWRYSEVDEYELPNVQLHPLDGRETLGMVLGGI